MSVVRRIVAYVCRLIRVLAQRVNATRISRMKLSRLLRIDYNIDSNSISGTEMATASKILVKQHQLSCLNPQIMKSLHHLNLREDNDGILRCYGRMRYSALQPSVICPMFVLQKSRLSQLIIEDCHTKGHPSYWIPKLRSQVTSVIRRCVACQKFNNLPFKYPEQPVLPSRRIQRSRPFAHVGLDYFGPLTISLTSDTTGKCYGCIITCMVTRLIHLDIARDLSTTAFLHVLRRFFARRGVPVSITSDNSPTFTLGKTVLKDCRRNIRSDPTISRMICEREIEWRYITPHAPWQGGVYERLIRSVKLALYKTLRKKTPSYEELSTVVIKIEAMLNTRPLLYVDSGPNADQILRPIDFLQDEFEIPFPLNSAEGDGEDLTYLPADERVALQSKMHVIRALKTSCEIPEKFWNIWQTQYLTSLREKHRSEVGKQRGSSYHPEKGKLVLICDNLQPRQSWKMGRIVELKETTDGTVREAVVILSSHRKIRRPINLLVPLELEDDHTKEHKDDDSSSANEVKQHQTRSLSSCQTTPQQMKVVL
ncbi:hypothetical protein RB195_022368 [Necator americanus]|uniref:Integrase catalytic domain-containing protein n=2 Tax=Necator americanus TaxID=51031 RepID=A0ABR1EG08_NECAM